MLPEHDTGEFTADPCKYVIARLEAAGRTLLRLPSSGCWPAGARSAWPEVVRSYSEQFALARERQDAGIPEPPPRLSPPSAHAIAGMDTAFGWLILLPDDKHVLRRIVAARALVDPRTDRHCLAWRRLGRQLGADYHAVQRWHAQGIGMIAAALAGSSSLAEKVFRDPLDKRLRKCDSKH